jgi:sulfide dehydrogenase [flavocytochrome c] flavoprotein subunit
MIPMNRRKFLQLLGAGGALAMTPSLGRLRAAGGSAARVVVVGGGFGGATAAKYLKLWNPAVEVTLVEPNASHISCILSNLALNGSLDLAQITFGYDELQKRGVGIVEARAAGVDPVARRVDLDNGQQLDYDRLILAPGIDFVPVPGLDFELVPHAWKAGPQTTLLQRQLAAMPAGGTFVMTVPKAPYRCPPGPYERACLVADYLRKNKPGSRVVVLDANPRIMAEEHTFSTAFEQTYAGMIDYHTDVALQSVNSPGRSAVTSAGTFRGEVLNVIPDQRAGAIAELAGTLNGGRWAAVDPLDYQSLTVPDVHVIGDAQGTGQPKSGHIANAEAKVCADAILRHFNGESPDPAPVTNSACYSPITADTASWLTAVFAYNPDSGAMQLVPESLGEANRPSRGNYSMMFDWASNLFADTFG